MDHKRKRSMREGTERKGDSRRGTGREGQWEGIREENETKGRRQEKNKRTRDME